MTDEEKQLTVVQQLPTQPLREIVVNDKVYECLTVEEALTEILEKVRALIWEDYIEPTLK